MKKVFSLLLLFLFCSGIGKAWHIAKDGFHIRRIGIWKEGFCSSLDDEAKAALAQPFRYLGRGHQCYAFASADGAYVIKIPRFDRYRIPFWLRTLPLSKFKKRREEDLAFRERFLLNSFQLSFDELRDQTALLAMHLAETADDGRVLTILDRFGQRYLLPLHKTAFVLQRKKDILMRTFQDALDAKQTQRATQMLTSFIDVIAERANKGILNKDPSFLRNFGYDGTRSFQIDIGSFYRKEGLDVSQAAEKSIRETLAPVRDWLEKRSPEMLVVFDQKLIEIQTVSRCEHGS